MDNQDQLAVALFAFELIAAWLADVGVQVENIKHVSVWHDIVPDTPVPDKTGRMWKRWKYGKGSTVSFWAQGKYYSKYLEPSPFTSSS
jgi:hypothetical protein